MTPGESQYFLGHAQKALDADNTSYRYDELASIYAGQDIQSFAHELGDVPTASGPGARAAGRSGGRQPETPDEVPQRS